jgi:hypothetical protein
VIDFNNAKPQSDSLGIDSGGAEVIDPFPPTLILIH